MRLVFKSSQEALCRILDPSAVTGGQQVKQQPTDRRYHESGRARRSRRVSVESLRVAEGAHPVGDNLLEELRELLRSL